LPGSTPVAIPLNTTDVANDVSIALDESSAPNRITVARSGVYNVAFSLQLIKEGSGTDQVSIWLDKNGSAVPWTATKIFLIDPGERDAKVAAWNFFVDLEAGDFVRLMIAATRPNRVTIAAVTDPTFPEQPFIPSTILTVNQVGD
jgi:hypothetical protein